MDRTTKDKLIDSFKKHPYNPVSLTYGKDNPVHPFIYIVSADPNKFGLSQSPLSSDGRKIGRVMEVNFQDLGNNFEIISETKLQRYQYQGKLPKLIYKDEGFELKDQKVKLIINTPGIDRRITSLTAVGYFQGIEVNRDTRKLYALLAVLPENEVKMNVPDRKIRVTRIRTKKFLQGITPYEFTGISIDVIASQTSGDNIDDLV